MKCSWSWQFDADHSLPFQTEVHRHSYWLECGYYHEINPTTGMTKAMADAQKDVDPLVLRVSGKYLNDVLPVPPTAEFLASWFLSNLPPYWDFALIRCYGSMTAESNRYFITSDWVEKLRASPA